MTSIAIPPPEKEYIRLSEQLKALQSARAEVDSNWLIGQVMKLEDALRDERVAHKKLRGNLYHAKYWRDQILRSTKEIFEICDNTSSADITWGLNDGTAPLIPRD